MTRTPEQEIARLLDTWLAKIAEGDTDALLDLYASDAVLVPTVSNRLRMDRAAMADYFDEFLQRAPSGRVDQSHVRIHGDIAINSGIYTLVLDAVPVAASGAKLQILCRFTFVYRRDQDRWKIIEHHSSTMPEP